MYLAGRLVSRLVAVTGAAVFFSHSAALASDAERILRALIGTGIGIVIDQQPRAPRRDTGNDARAARSRAEPAISRAEAFRIQNRLNELGYAVGEPDGALGRNSRRGIRQYQMSVGAEPTGYLTTGQKANLLAGSGPATVPDNSVPLRSAEIRDMQEALNRLGYRVGRPDGNLGPATGRAVARYLADRGRDAYQTSERDALAMIVGEAAPGGPPASEPTVAASQDAVEARELTYKELFKLFLARNQDHLDEHTRAVNFGYIIEDPDAKSEACRSYAAATNTVAARRTVDEIAGRYRAAEASGTLLTGGDRFVTTIRVRDAFLNYDFERKGLATEAWRGVKMTAEIYDGRSQLEYRPCHTILDLPKRAGLAERFRMPVEYRFDFIASALEKLEAGDGFPVRMQHFGLVPMSPEQGEALLDRPRDQNVIIARVEFTFVPLTPYADANFNANMPTHAADVHSVTYLDEATGRELFRYDIDAAAPGAEPVPTSLPDYADHLMLTHLEYKDGAAVLGSGSAINYQEQRVTSEKNLLTMLLLASDPGLAATPEYGPKFVYLLGDRAKAYGEVDSYRGFNFRGSNEFERRDMFDRYIREGLPQIVAELPRTPLDVIDLWQVRLGDYDDARQAFPIEFGGSKISDIGNADLPARLRAPQPFVWPSEWPVRRDEARDLVERLAAARKIALADDSFLEAKLRTGIMAARLRVSGTRKVDSGEGVLDLSLVSIDLFGDDALTMPIASFPIPPGSRLADGPTVVSDLPPSLDGEAMRLLAIKLDPALADDDAFLSEAMAERARIEARKDYATSFAPVLPLAVSKGGAKSNEADLASFRDWLRATPLSLGDTLRFADGLAGQRSDDGVLTVSLDKSLANPWRENPVFGRAAQNPAALAAARAAYPDAAGYAGIATGGGMAAVAAFRSHPAWFEVKLETGDRRGAAGNFVGHADFRVGEAKLSTSPDGTRFVLVELVPIAVVHVTDDGREVKVVLEDDGPVVGAGFDVLGARLGMSLGDALAAARREIDASSREVAVASNDPYLSTGREAVVVVDGRIVHQVGLFAEADDSTSPVIGVGRYLEFGATGATVDQVIASMIAKYGEPDAVDRSGDHAYLAWLADRGMKALAAREGIGLKCILYPFRNYRVIDTSASGVDPVPPEGSEGPRHVGVNTLEATDRCGVVLSASVNEGSVALMLIDTSAMIDLREKPQETADEAVKPAVPAIKF